MPKFELGNQATRDLNTVRPQQQQRDSSIKLKLNRQNFIRRRQSDLTEKYIYGDKIGEGSFGQVFKVIHKQLKIVRALKIIKKTPQSASSHNAYEQLQILKRLDHPNVLKVYEYFQSDINWFIITEYFQGKQLFDEIVTQKRLTQRKAALIFAQVCKAVAYIHAHSIVHRDIKPQNILVRKHKLLTQNSAQYAQSGVDQYQYEIKLIDWGLGSLQVKQLMRKCGTPQYCAPEILQGSYGFECDLWSLGVLLYVMLIGRFPFKGNSVQQTLYLVSRAQLSFKSHQWQQISIQAKYLISHLIKKQPKLRLKATQILKSEWILYHIQHQKSTKSIQKLEQDENQLKQTLIRLKQVTIDNKFQAVVINFIHNFISSTQKQNQLKKQFELLDQNKDGVLSYEQLFQGYSNIYPHLSKSKLEDIVHQIFRNIDLDGSGYIQYSEFITFATKIQKKFSEKQLKQVFNLLDEDGNGRINKREINSILMYEKGAQSQQFDQIINQIDLDGDGSISLQEFTKNINHAVNKVIKQTRKSQSKSKKKQLEKQNKQHKHLEKGQENQTQSNTNQRKIRQSFRQKLSKDQKINASLQKQKILNKKQKNSSEEFGVNKDKKNKSKSKNKTDQKHINEKDSKNHPINKAIQNQNKSTNKN